MEAFSYAEGSKSRIRISIDLKKAPHKEVLKKCKIIVLGATHRKNYMIRSAVGTTDRAFNPASTAKIIDDRRRFHFIIFYDMEWCKYAGNHFYLIKNNFLNHRHIKVSITPSIPTFSLDRLTIKK